MKEEKTASRFKALFAERRQSAGANISWGSVLAGLLTFVAIIIMGLFVAGSVGFGAIDLYAPNPFANLGLGLIISVVVTLVLAFFFAGMVAGITSGRVGFVHGFLTWAASLILGLILIINSTLGIFNALSSTLGFVGKSTGKLVSSTGESLETVTEKAISKIQKEVSVDTKELSKEAEEVLKDTEVKELQPEYIKEQVAEVYDDLKASGQKLLKDPTPETLNAEFKSLLENVKARAEKIAKAPDEDAVAKAVSKNSSLTESEARESTRKIVSQYKESVQKVKEGFAKLEKRIEKLKDDLNSFIEKAKAAADEAAHTASTVSLYAFIAMIVCLFITGFGGSFGAAVVRRRQRDLV